MEAEISRGGDKFISVLHFLSCEMAARLGPTLRTLLASPTAVDSTVKVEGWLRSVRAHKNVVFGEVDDGTSRLQAVFKGAAREG